MEKLNWKIVCLYCGTVQWASMAVEAGDERIRRCVGICSDCFEQYQKTGKVGPPVDESLPAISTNEKVP